jgi:hypothetical protein
MKKKRNNDKVFNLFETRKVRKKSVANKKKNQKNNSRLTP